MRELGVEQMLMPKRIPPQSKIGQPSPRGKIDSHGEERFAVAAQDASARDDDCRVVLPVVVSFDDAEDQNLAHRGQPRQDHGERG